MNEENPCTCKKVGRTGMKITCGYYQDGKCYLKNHEKIVDYDHIKTGEEIITSILEGKHTREEKWISFLWLMKELKTLIQSKENKSEYYIAIVDVLDLLLREYGKEF